MVIAYAVTAPGAGSGLRVLREATEQVLDRYHEGTDLTVLRAALAQVEE